MKHARVLLADSHLNMLGGVHSLLEALFETVLMVADERSLEDALATSSPDLVIVDLSLPGGDTNIARRLTDLHPDLRFILLSVHDEPAVVDKMMKTGAAGFVLKRAAATDLIPAVREVLQGGSYVSPAIQRLRTGSPDPVPPVGSKVLPGSSFDKEQGQQEGGTVGG